MRVRCALGSRALGPSHPLGPPRARQPRARPTRVRPGSLAPHPLGLRSLSNAQPTRTASTSQAHVRRGRARAARSCGASRREIARSSGTARDGEKRKGVHVQPGCTPGGTPTARPGRARGCRRSPRGRCPGAPGRSTSRAPASPSSAPACCPQLLSLRHRARVHQSLVHRWLPSRHGASAVPSTRIGRRRRARQWRRSKGRQRPARAQHGAGAGEQRDRPVEKIGMAPPNCVHFPTNETWRSVNLSIGLTEALFKLKINCFDCPRKVENTTPRYVQSPLH